jgi:uncharacterized cupin superfamily protein
MADPKHIVRTAQTDWTTAWHARHPLNEASEWRMLRLGATVGMRRLPVNLIRVPPGKETFVPHAHGVEEEWVFVLEGAATLDLDGESHAIGPGDYIGFPIDGLVHQIRNTGLTDLLYLTGGEAVAVDVVKMPSLGKVTVFDRTGARFFDADAAEVLTNEEWMKRAMLD